MAKRGQILTRDEPLPLPHKMDEEIASAIHRALFHRKAPGRIQIMNAERNTKGTIRAIPHQHATAAMALAYSDDIITAARTVSKGVTNVVEKDA
jgi:hypothetical protein